MERFIIVTATARGRQYRIEKTEYRIQKRLVTVEVRFFTK